MIDANKKLVNDYRKICKDAYEKLCKQYKKLTEQEYMNLAKEERCFTCGDKVDCQSAYCSAVCAEVGHDVGIHS